MAEQSESIDLASIRQLSFLINEIKPDCSVIERAQVLKSCLDVEEILEPRIRGQILSASNPVVLDKLSSLTGASKESLLDRGYSLKSNESRVFRDILQGKSGQGIDKDNRKQTYMLPSIADSLYPVFDHQKEISDKIISQVERGDGRCIVHMPTGTGKTRTAMSTMCRLIIEKKMRCCWITYSKALVRQAVKEFVRAWKYRGDGKCNIGYLIGDETTDLALISSDIRVLFASFTRLSLDSNTKDRKLIEIISQQADILFIDEAHEAIAEGRGIAIRAIKYNSQGTRLVGLSATPGRSTEGYRQDDYDLAETFGTNKITLDFPGHLNPIDYLTSNGYLAKPNFFYIDSAEEDGTESDCIEEAIRAIELIRLHTERHFRIMVFCKSVKYSKWCAALLVLSGIEAYHVEANTPDPLRESIYERFNSSVQAPMVLLNYNVLGTGFDAPAVSCILVLRVVKSLVQMSQIIGRGLRGPVAGGTPTVDVGLTAPTGDRKAMDIANMFMNWNHLWEEA